MSAEVRHAIEARDLSQAEGSHGNGESKRERDPHTLVSLAPCSRQLCFGFRTKSLNYTLGKLVGSSKKKTLGSFGE